MKYIFIAGAPGSKWSSVAKNINFSPSIDRSDHSLERTYFHDATGRTELMHLGAYFDPGMEFGDWFSHHPGLGERSKQEHELEFDRPFSGTGVRIIKSHWFSYTQHIEFLKKTWPECPVVLVHRPDDACLGWWVKCGHFDITYPDYHKYYRDLKHMAKEIQRQNSSMYPYWDIASFAFDNVGLCTRLGISAPDETYRQNYSYSKVRVKVL
jgi:hypothetical protein